MNLRPRGIDLKSLIDVRAFVFALGFALAATLPVLTTLKERREFYLFDIGLSSTVSGLTRVSWDTGHGFSERDSSAQPLKANPQQRRYLYLLPTGQVRALRFSLIDRAATLTLGNARVVDRHGAVIQAFSSSDFVAGLQIANLQNKSGQLIVNTVPDATAPFLDLRLESPLQLPLKSSEAWRAAVPIFFPVFLVGLFLSSPWLLGRAARVLRPTREWAGKNSSKTILVVAAIAVALQAYPVVFLGRSFVSPNNGSSMLYGRLPTLPGYTDPSSSNTMGSDVGALFFHHLYAPMVQREALWEHGELPLWNRYNLTGTPLLGQGQSMFGDPFNLITIAANGAGWAWDLRFVLARFLFALGLGWSVYRLTRNLGAALLVTLAAPFVGFFLFRINHPANFSVGYAPWILWSWIGYIQSRDRRGEVSWLASLLATSWTVMTSGTVKEAYMLIVCLNAAGLILLLLTPTSPGRRTRLAVYAGVAGLVFVLITAPLWSSFLVTLRHSFTVYDKPSVQTLSLTHIIGFFDEMFYREGFRDERVVAHALNAFFLLGILWWFSSPSLWKRDRAGLALCVASILPLSIAFGIVPAALLKTPFLGKIFHLGNTFSCPLLILLALVAGCGFHDAIVRWQRAEKLGLRVVSTLGLAAVLSSMYFVTTTGSPKSLFFMGYAATLGFAAVALLIGVGWSARSRSSSLLVVCVGLALPLLLWRHGQYRRSVFNQYVFTPGLRVNFFASSPAVGRIDRDRGVEPARTIGLQYNLFPTYNVALGWESLYGVDALRNRAYDELSKSFGLVRVWDWEQPTAADGVPAQRPLYDLLNVGYYLADHAAADEGPAGLSPVAEEDLDVWKSPSRWPRAFFSDRLAGYNSVDDFATKLRHGDGKPFAAVDHAEPELGQLPSLLPGRIIKAATDYRLTANTTSFVVEAPKPGVAVLTEAYLPEDFEATVNGVPTTYFRVNHAFKGVLLNAPGTYRITYTYYPKYFKLSLWLSATGLVLAALGAGIISRRSDPSQTEFSPSAKEDV